MFDYGSNSEAKSFLMMCLMLLYDVEKIGYGTWLTKLTVRTTDEERVEAREQQSQK